MSADEMRAEHAANLYRAFFEHSMDAVLLTAPDGAIAAANPAACQMFGRTEADLCKAGRAGLVDAASPCLQDLLDERARTGKARGELIFIRGDGSRFPGEVSSELFTDAGGLTRTVMTIRDLSQKKQAEQEQERLIYEVNKNAAEVEAILASQEDAILLYDMSMCVLRANPSFSHNYGFDPVGLHVKGIIERVACRLPDGRPLVLNDQPTPRALRGEKVAHAIYAVTRADGTTAMVETSSRPLYVGDSIIGTVTVWHDITELKHAEEALKKSAQEIEDLYNHAPCGYHSLDKDGTVVRINETELAWLGYKRDEIVGKMKWQDLITPAGLQTFRENFPVFLKQGYINDLEIEILRKDGTSFMGLVNASAIFDASGNYLMSRSTVFDISERKAMENKMRYMANYDALTDLPNRSLVFDRLHQAIAAAKRRHARMALMYLDLDQFKPINDTLGHEIGDLLLQEVAQRLRDCVRESDTVGRMGGDEFVVVLPSYETLHDVMQAADKIRLRLNQPFTAANRDLRVSSSIGIALYPEHGEDGNKLLKRADAAMYDAKEGGGNRVSIYSGQISATDK
jgi:diguanylate cyclase (GGDEF)-like protein/PAS domain S-box-containing protein